MITTCINCKSNRFVKGYLRPMTDGNITSTFSVLGNAYDISMFYNAHELMDMQAMVCQDCGMVTFTNDIFKGDGAPIVELFKALGGRTLDKNKILLVCSDSFKKCSKTGFTVSTLANITNMFPSPKNPEALVLELDKDIMPDDIITVSYNGGSDNVSIADKQLQVFDNIKIQNTIEQTFININNAIVQKDGVTIYAYTDAELLITPLTVDQISYFKIKDYNGMHDVVSVEIVSTATSSMGSNLLKIVIDSANKLSSSDEPSIVYLTPSDNSLEILGTPNGLLYNSTVSINVSLIPDDVEKNILVSTYKTYENKVYLKTSIKADILLNDFEVHVSVDEGVSFVKHEFIVNTIETEILKTGSILSIGEVDVLEHNKRYVVKLVNKNYGHNRFKKQSKLVYFETSTNNGIRLNVFSSTLNETTGKYDVMLQWDNISSTTTIAYIKTNRSDSSTWITESPITNMSTTSYTIKNLEPGYKYQFKLSMVKNVHGGSPVQEDTNIVLVNLGSLIKDRIDTTNFGLTATTVDSTTGNYNVKLKWAPINSPSAVKNADRFYLYWDTRPISDPKLFIRLGYLNYAKELDVDDFTVIEYTDKTDRATNTAVYYFLYAIDKSGNEYYSDVVTVTYKNYVDSHDIKFDATSVNQQSLTVTYNISNIEDTVYVYMYAKDKDSTSWTTKIRINPNDSKEYTINGLLMGTTYDIKMEVKWTDGTIKSGDSQVVVGVNNNLKNKTKEINIDTRDGIKHSYSELLAFRQNIGESITAFTNTRNASIGASYFKGSFQGYMNLIGNTWDYHNTTAFSDYNKDYIPACIKAKSGELKDYSPTGLYKDYGGWIEIYKFYCNNNKIGSELVATASYKDSDGYEGDVIIKWHQDIFTHDTKPLDGNGNISGHILRKDGTPIGALEAGCKWNYITATNYWWEAHGTVIKR